MDYQLELLIKQIRAYHLPQVGKVLGVSEEPKQSYIELGVVWLLRGKTVISVYIDEGDIIGGTLPASLPVLQDFAG